MVEDNLEQSKHADDSSGTPKSTRSSSRKKIVIALIVFIAIFLAVPYWYTSNPLSCTRCHEMEPYYKSWRESPHATATKNCFTCHVEAGSLNLWIYRVSFYREIYASMVGAKLKPANANLPTLESCQKHGCHSLNRDISTSGNIRISHRNHITKAHLSCPRCHPGAAHPNVGKTGKATPSRKMCKQCHQAVANTCGFCHTKTDQLLQGYKH